MANIEDLCKNENYFKSPVETLLETVEGDGFEQVTLVDTLQAYCTLSTRVGHALTLLSECGDIPPSIKYLASHAESLVKALRRDIGAVLINPVPEPVVYSNAIPVSIPDSQRECTDDELKYASDVSSLCQYALTFLSTIFKFSFLSSCFLDDDLSQLLGIVCQIILAPFLPTPNEAKVHAHATCAVAFQRLPLVVLQSKSTEILKILQAVKQTIIPQSEQGLIKDVFRLHYNLMTSHPTVFLSPCSKLLPPILNHLLSPAQTIRTEAAFALGGFALASLRGDVPSDDRLRLADAVSTFIRVNTSSSIREENSQTLTQTIEDSLQSSNRNNPLWSYSLLSSIIVISDGTICFRTRFLPLLFNTIKQGRLKKTLPKQVHSSLWRCLVWATFRELDHIGNRKEGRHVDNFTGGLKVIKQELHGGIGAAILYALLGNDHPIPGDSVKEALDVVDRMVKDKHQSVHIAGISLLSRLISAIGSPVTHNDLPGGWNIDCILGKAMFDGSVLRADTHLTGVPLWDFETSKVRCLTEAELSIHWNTIIQIWFGCIEKALSEGRELPLSDELLQIWQALLLCQTQLTQGCGHLSPEPDIANRVVLLMLCLLTGTGKSKEANTEGVNFSQLLRLRTIHHLWAVLKNVFATPWVTQSATSLLRSLLTNNFPLDDANIKAVWSDLCSDLLTFSSPNLPPSFLIGSHENQESQLKRQMWHILAESWQCKEWQVTIAFLAIPIRTWTLSEEETSLWIQLLQHAVTAARKARATLPSAYDGIADHIFPIQTNNLNHHLIIILLTSIQASHCEISLSLLYSINEFLCGVYPPPTEKLPLALEIFDTLTKIVTTYPLSKLVTFLGDGLQEALLMWIGDEKRVTLEAEYNAVIMKLYCSALTRLAILPPDVEILQKLESFFISVFKYTPSPGLGPEAFVKYFDLCATHIDNETLTTFCPMEIQTCVEAYRMAHGSSFEILESQSQPQYHSDLSSTSVPNSQPEATDDHLVDFPPNFHERVLATPSSRLSNLHRMSLNSSPTSSDIFVNNTLIPTPSSPLRREDSLPDPLMQSPEIPLPSLRDDSSKIPELSFSVHVPSSPLQGQSMERTRKRLRDTSGVDELTSVSQRRDREKFDDIDEVHQTPVTKKAKRIQAVISDDPSSPDTKPSAIDYNGHVDSDDYESWEVSVATPEARRIQQELGIEVNINSDLKAGTSSSKPTSEECKDVGPGRSQSAPVPPTQPNPRLLRRAKTTPVELQTLEDLHRMLRKNPNGMSLQERIAFQRELHQIQSLNDDEINTMMNSEA
ncbi:hypothetical protein C8Q75DRAFT_867298 [Abortiporus biennis]|nr:hypothetical protein C8Q75DRAFT_867298 [Abortiporus biennis]